LVQVFFEIEQKKTALVQLMNDLDVESRATYEQDRESIERTMNAQILALETHLGSTDAVYEVLDVYAESGKLGLTNHLESEGK